MSNVKHADRSIPSRREFLRKSAVAVAGGAIASQLGVVPAVHAAGSNAIKIGLIGCGRRGTGATVDAVRAAPNVQIVAMGDVFKDHLDRSRNILKKTIADALQVTDDHCFIGLDAYQKVLASNANYIILATPPGFRPIHLQACVAAGKNTFTEKPVAVDAPGIRACLAAYEKAKSKGVAIGAGTLYRHSVADQETAQRLHDGAIGQITSGRSYYLTGSIWVYPRQPGWSDLEWQLRNWYYFTWLSGDFIVEQHVHNLDKDNWMLGSHPLRATSLGGRQVRTEPVYGQIYDHFATEYEYPNNCHVTSMCRQMTNCDVNVSDAYAGTKGFCKISPLRRYQITGAEPWTYAGKIGHPYVKEHADLIESIRSGNPINELKDVTESTLTALMGRMSAYTGKTITWEQALNSTENLMPAKLDWNAPLPVGPVPMPGQTEFL